MKKNIIVLLAILLTACSSGKNVKNDSKTIDIPKEESSNQNTTVSKEISDSNEKDTSKNNTSKENTSSNQENIPEDKNEDSFYLVSGEVPRNSIDYLKANVDSLLNPDFFKYDKDKKVLISEPYTLGQGTYVFVVKQDNKKLCSIFLTDKGNGDFDWQLTIVENDEMDKMFGKKGVYEFVSTQVGNEKPIVTYKNIKRSDIPKGKTAVDLNKVILEYNAK